MSVQNKNPLVSVIVPMYNSAKFIPQTLESLLYQTMPDFEVVIVDDCSTDNSVEVVKSFLERFGGRLKLVKLKKNTGSPAIPRNVGTQLARGKYITYMDADDLFVKNALGKLATLAEKYQVEVLNTDYRFNVYNGEKLSEDDPRMTDFAALTDPKNFTVVSEKKTPLDNSTRFETLNLAERVRRWVSWDYPWGTPALFCKREFLITNQIFFPKLRLFEDMSFFFECLCKARKFLRAPLIAYIVRPRLGSLTRDKEVIDVKKTFHDYFRTVKDGFKEFERIMGNSPFFAQNPSYRYAVLKFFFDRSYVWPWSFKKIYMQIPAYQLNALIKAEFNPDNAALAAYLFNKLSRYKIQIAHIQREINALKQQEDSNVEK